jgi:hypothetical protein
MAASKYKNLVNILDEMSITQTKRYAIGEFTEVDSMIIYDIIQEEQ